MYLALASEVASCERAVARRLTHQLAKDGLWRDFSLQPGQSDCWASAWIGWGLAHAPPDPSVSWALRAVTTALLRCVKQDGWGYNQLTGCDADSTAWVVRLFAVTNPVAARQALPALQRYVDPSGEAHTFADAELGRWSAAHADVTAMVGLAQLDADATRYGGTAATSAFHPIVGGAIGSSQYNAQSDDARAGYGGIGVTERIRRAILARAAISWPPQNFWWGNPAYGLAWTLAFLARSGGVPQAVASSSSVWLDDHSGCDMAPCDHALDLLGLLGLGRASDELATWHVCRLLAACRTDAWDGTARLLVPPKRLTDGIDPSGPANADSGAMTSSLVLAALARWRRAIADVASQRSAFPAMAARAVSSPHQSGALS